MPEEVEGEHGRAGASIEGTIDEVLEDMTTASEAPGLRPGDAGTVAAGFVGTLFHAGGGRWEVLPDHWLADRQELHALYGRFSQRVAVGPGAAWMALPGREDLLAQALRGQVPPPGTRALVSYVR